MRADFFDDAEDFSSCMHVVEGPSKIATYSFRDDGAEATTVSTSVSSSHSFEPIHHAQP